MQNKIFDNMQQFMDDQDDDDSTYEFNDNEDNDEDEELDNTPTNICIGDVEENSQEYESNGDDLYFEPEEIDLEEEDTQLIDDNRNDLDCLKKI